MVIAVPAITNYIEKSRMDSFRRSTETLFSAAAHYLVDNDMDNFPDEGMSITNLDYNKTKLTSGIVYSVDEKFELENVTDGEFCANGMEKNLTVKHEACSEIVLSKPTFKSDLEGWSQYKNITIEYPEGNMFFFKSTGTITVDKKVSKCSVVNEKSSTCEETQINENTLLEANTWYKTSKKVKVHAEDNMVLYGHEYDNRRYISSSYEVEKIDRTLPTSSTFTTKSTSKSIEVEATGIDIESGILKYQFSKDDGTTWTSVQDSNKYTYNNLETGTYKIKVRVINGTYVNHELDNNYLDSEMKLVSTTAIEASTYTVTPSGWSQSKTVTINYKSGYTNEYKIDSGEWKEYTSPLEFTETGTVITRVNDGKNYVTGSTLTVTGIDLTAPTSATFTYEVTGLSIKVTATGVDSESGIYGYQFSKDNGSTWTSVQTSNVYTFSGLSKGTYPIKVKVLNGTYTSDGMNSKNSLISEAQNCITSYTVTISSGTGGTTNVSSVDVSLGGSSTFTVTPTSGYYLSSASCTNGYTINYNKASASQTVTVNNPNVSMDSVCTLAYGTNNVSTAISWPSGSSRYDGWGTDGNGSGNDSAHTYTFNSSTFDITNMRTLTFNYASSGDGWSTTYLYLKWNGTVIWQGAFGDSTNKYTWNNSGSASVNISGYTGTGYLTFVVANSSCGQGGSISSMYATISY